MPMVEKLNKTPRGRIYAVETYKINCGKNLLVGLESIKAAEETSLDKNDFVHVVISALENYDEPVIVKAYDAKNGNLQKEIQILKVLYKYRNTADLICDFSCTDDKNRYLRKIKQKIKFCGNGADKLHFFVYKYIKGGDIGDFLTKTTDENMIKSLILQIMCVIIEVGSIYKIYHGDINSGNILVDETEEETMEYVIDGENILINTHGIMPKIIDFGRSQFYTNEKILVQDIVEDIVIALNLLYKYSKNAEIKDKLDFIISGFNYHDNLRLTKLGFVEETDFYSSIPAEYESFNANSLADCYKFIEENLHNK